MTPKDKLSYTSILSKAYNAALIVHKMLSVS